MESKKNSENIKIVKINGIKTKVVLPKTINKKEFPKEIRMPREKVGGLVCTL